MTTKEFNNLEEIQKYYVVRTNTYVFKEDDEYIDLVIFNFDLELNSNISAKDIVGFGIDVLDINCININCNDIYAFNINAYNICAFNINANIINAYNIVAHDIIYYAFCFAYFDIKCKLIKGITEYAKHFVLDGVLEVEDDRKTND